MGKRIKLAAMALVAVLLVGLIGPGQGPLPEKAIPRLRPQYTNPQPIGLPSLQPQQTPSQSLPTGAPETLYPAPLPAPEAPDPEPVTLPNYTATAAYAAAIPWKRAFFDVTMQQLQAGWFIRQVELFYEGDDSAYIVLRRSVDRKEGPSASATQIWKFEDGKTCLCAELGQNELETYQIDTQKGTARLATKVTGTQNGEQSEGYRYMEYSFATGHTTNLYEQYYDGDAFKQGGTVLYTFNDNRSWTLEEMTKENPLAAYHFRRADDILNFSDYEYPENQYSQEDVALYVAHQLAEWLLDAYTPAVPAGAPLWVGQYVRYFRSHNMMPRGREGAEEEMWLPSGTKQVVLYQPLWPGGPPPIMAKTSSSSTHGWENLRYIVNSQVYQLNPPHMESAYRLYKDANGNPILIFSASAGIQWDGEYYRLSSQGMQLLFNSGGRLCGSEGGVDNGYRYAGTGFLWSTNVEELDAWHQRYLDRLLAAHGYAGPFTTWPGITYTLSQADTWAGLESQLVDALCAFAKHIGQWG